MTFIEFAECNRYGVNILSSEEKVDIWDSLANVNQSSQFNSRRRIQPMKLYKSVTFGYTPASYNDSMRYTFEFSVRRLVYLTSVAVTRSCMLSITEKKPVATEFIVGSKYVVHVNETKSIKYAFVPNVIYVMTTVDGSFRCGRMCSKWDIKFKNYSEMQDYYNQIATVES